MGFYSTSLDSKSYKPPCYETHPALKVGEYVIYGGSASYPIVQDADVYVSLQRGSSSSKISDPWDEQKVVEIQFGITDQHAPDNLPRFKKMITWLCNQLQAGKKVHVGCIGGHGRTGLVLAAIVAEMTGEKNAIQYVRKHYCKKAVESERQIKFLMKHYGVNEASPSKHHESSGNLHFTKTDDIGGGKKDKWFGGFLPPKTEEFKSPSAFKGSTPTTSKVIRPYHSARCLWRKPE